MYAKTAVIILASACKKAPFVIGAMTQIKSEMRPIHSTDTGMKKNAFGFVLAVLNIRSQNIIIPKLTFEKGEYGFIEKLMCAGNIFVATICVTDER